MRRYVHATVEEVYGNPFLCRIRDDPIDNHAACCRHYERGNDREAVEDVRIMDVRMHRTRRRQFMDLESWRPVAAVVLFIDFAGSETAPTWQTLYRAAVSGARCFLYDSGGRRDREAWRIALLRALEDRRGNTHSMIEDAWAAVAAV